MKNNNRTFRFRVFRNIVVLLLLVASSIGFLYAWTQRRTLEENLAEDGISVAQMLATSLRLGILSESEEFLTEPIDGALEQKGVIQVMVYKADGRLLKTSGEEGLGGLGNPFEVMNQLREPGSISHLRGNRHSEFWAPVFYQKSQIFHEDGFFPSPTGQEVLIGFVKVSISRDRIIKGTNAIIFGTIAVTAMFISLGSLVAYLVARRITDPLNTFVHEIEGMREEVRQVQVKGDTEIIRLASAFNKMAESLKKRDMERKKAEEEKRKLEQVYYQSQKLESLGRLVGGIAHDFNNILAIIHNNMELASLRANESISDYIRRSSDAVRRGRNIVENLMIFSDGAHDEESSLNLGKIIKDTVQFMGKDCREAIKIKLDIMEGLWSVHANPCQLQQVIMNLYQNAKEAILDLKKNKSANSISGTISFRVENIVVPHVPINSDVHEFVRITVIDNGCGMDALTASRVFEPFFSTKEGSNRGMGLSSAYGIIKHYGGWVDIESKLGKGTVLNIYLPRHSGASPRATTPAKEHSSSELVGGMETVLVVDDEEHVADTTTEILKHLGYNVHTAYTGKDAFRLFKKNSDSIDLIVTDTVMPDVSGSELVIKIKEITPDMPIVVASANIKYSQEILSGIENINFISKPYDLRTIANVVRNALGETAEPRTLKQHLSRIKIYSVRDRSIPYDEHVSDPESIYELFKHLANETKEKFIVIFLDIQNRIIAYEDIAQGTIDKVEVYPQEIIRAALLVNAASVLLLHNHPSGKAEPSDNDIVITAQVMQACMLLNIKLFDHIIIGENGYLSFANSKLL